MGGEGRCSIESSGAVFWDAVQRRSGAGLQHSRAGHCGADSVGHSHGKVASTAENVVKHVPWEKDLIEAVLTSRSPPRKGAHTLLRGTSWFGSQRTPRLRVTTTIAKTKRFVKWLCKIFKRKRTPSAADSDAHRGFASSSDLYMFVADGQKLAEDWTHPVDEVWIKTLRSPPYCPKTMTSDNEPQESVFRFNADSVRSPRARVLF